MDALRDAWTKSTPRSISRAVLRGSQCYAQLSLADPAVDATRRFSQVFQLTDDDSKLEPASFPAELPPSAHLQLVSPSGRYQLTANYVAAADGKPARGWLERTELATGELLRVWTHSCHGRLYTDGWFQGVTWSPDEATVVYVAEGKPAKTPSLWDGELAGDSDGGKASGDAAGDDDSLAGREFDSKPSWGERYAGKELPALFVARWAAAGGASVAALPCVPDGISAGQPALSPDGKTLLFTGWDAEPRLGMVYCHQRRCAIYSLPLCCDDDGDEEKGDDDDKPVAKRLTVQALSSDAHWSPDGSCFVYTAADATSLHNTGFTLCRYHMATSSARVLLPLVRRADSEADGFPGFFRRAPQPSSIFTACGNFVLVNSCWGSSGAIVRVDLHDGARRRLPASKELQPGNWVLQDVGEDYVLALHSTPISPPRLVLLDLDGRMYAQSAAAAMPALRGASWSVLSMKDDDGLPFDALLLQPAEASEQAVPLVLAPHGGPHSVFTASYYSSYAFLLASGYAACLVNYRGSIGFGMDALEALPGKIGSVDVADCWTALEQAIAAGNIDVDRLAVAGGSHGGFLTAHLVAGERRFRVAAARNPASDLLSMASTTDITDWCWAEAGLPYDYASHNAITAEVAAKMAAVSPMAAIATVETPLLVCLGLKDLRVPPSTGRSLYLALHRLGKETKLLEFPQDCHAIDRPRSSATMWLNIVRYFRDHGC
eukprot:PLAT10657.1.p1 GENE.PLAT10657.1~~PLAT10657.1.p1  ORF type:complete len:717 (-),score=276.31 PLAT10657.1:77-2227(-)